MTSAPEPSEAITLVHHPDQFATGTRVLFLTGRKKDGIEDARLIARVTHSAEKHAKVLGELLQIARPGERIYGSVDERDVAAAARYFRHRQIDAEEADPAFYQHLEARWVSALMQPDSRAEKLWLIDIDTPLHGDVLATFRANALHEYPTKNGAHIIVKPFDRRLIPQETHAIIKTNGMMLWAF